MKALKFIQQFFLNRSKRTSPGETGKSFEKKYNEPGVFKYDEEGFTIEYEEISMKISWDDITEIIVYKTDLFTFDRIEMEILYGEKSLVITEDLPGWYQFVLKTKEIFPSIPRDWDVNIIHPAFASNLESIYRKV